VRDGYEVMLISQDGTVIRTSVDGISRMGRSTQGVRLMNLRRGDKVSAIARVTDATGPLASDGDDPGDDPGAEGGADGDGAAPAPEA
jgi:DNA gyrase subunit A